MKKNQKIIKNGKNKSMAKERVLKHELVYFEDFMMILRENVDEAINKSVEEQSEHILTTVTALDLEKAYKIVMEIADKVMERLNEKSFIVSVIHEDDGKNHN